MGISNCGDCGYRVREDRSCNCAPRPGDGPPDFATPGSPMRHALGWDKPWSQRLQEAQERERQTQN